MNRFTILTARIRTSVLLVCASLLAATPALADDVDNLPLPRSRPAPKKLVLPPAITAPVTKEPAGDAIELPRPEGRPGRAPDPPGSGAENVAPGKADKEEGKNKESPLPDGRCDQCGSCDCVRKVCVPKMTEKEIKKVCWDSRCEDFCVPGRSVWCGTVCKKDDCGCWTHELWKPTCAEVKTRVVPVRKETKRKVPAVEWKVEERCACCRRKPRELAGRTTPPEKFATVEKGLESTRK